MLMVFGMPIMRIGANKIEVFERISKNSRDKELI